MKKTYIYFILMVLIFSVGAASAKQPNTIIDMSHKSISASQYNKVISNVHFDKNVKDISHFKVSKNKNARSVKVELTNEYAEAHTQTIGVPLDDLPDFVDLVMVQHFTNDGKNDYSQIIRPNIIGDVAYVDVTLSSVTITPYVSYLTNGGFEEWSTETVPLGWAMDYQGGSPSTSAESGSYAYQITGNGSSVRGSIHQTASLTPGYYTIGAWVKSTGITSGRLSVDLIEGTPYIDSNGISVSGNHQDYTWYEYREYINSTNPSIRIYSDGSLNTGGTFYIDDVVLSQDYSYTASETPDASHLYQNFTYTPNAVYTPAQFITKFSSTDISNYNNPQPRVTIDGNVVTSWISGNQVRFDTSGLSASAHQVNVVVTYTPSVVANFTANTTSVIAGNPIQFTDTSAGAPNGWMWNFGDGTTSTEQNPIHVYTSNGQKTVTLTATGDYGSDGETKTNYITVVYNAPVSNFYAYKQDGYQFQFTDTSQNSPTSWYWDFGDGQTSTAQSPTHNFGQNGTFTVTLNASNPAGSSTSSQQVTMSAQSGHSSIESTDQLVMVSTNETHSFNFTSNITLDHTIFYVNGAPMQVTGNELIYTFPPDSSGKYYNVTAVGYSGDGIKSNEYTWNVQVKRLRATADEKIEKFNTSDYDKFVDNYTKFDSEGMIETSMNPYTNLIGRSFYLILFAMPFVLLWQKQGRMTIPTTLALITGALFIGFIPEQYVNFIVYAIILSFAGNLYMMGRQTV